MTTQNLGHVRDITTNLGLSQVNNGQLTVTLPATPAADRVYRYLCEDFCPCDEGLTLTFAANTAEHIEGDKAELVYDRNNRHVLWMFDGATWRIIQ